MLEALAWFVITATLHKPSNRKQYRSPVGLGMQVLERAVVLYFIPFFLQAKFTSQLLLKHCLFVFLFYILNGQCINNEPIDYKNILQSHLEPMYKPTTNQYQTILNFPQPSTVFIFILCTTNKANMNFLTSRPTR